MSPDELPADVRRALDALAAEDAAGVLAEARAAARARARALLEDELVARLLERAGGGAAVERSPRPAGAAPPAEPTPPARAAPPSEAAPPAVDAPPGEAIYLYGVVRAADTPLGELTGLGPVEIVGRDDLAAVVSPVPLSEFGDEHLKENLERMDWLERTARAHEDAIAAVREQATVVPMRLCTVFHSRHAVTDMLDREGEVLRDALERLDGRTEWGVKVLADLGAARAAVEREAGADTAGDAGLSEGRGYLAARRREREAGDALDARLRAAVRDVHETLAAKAEAALRNPVQHRDLSGYEGEMLLNGVYLVDDARTAGFHARIDALAERHARIGLTLERTGPWPPYNFVAPAQEP
jgi:hypothetical protein